MLFHTELLSLLKIKDKNKIMKNLKELEQKYLELGKEIEALKKQNTEKEELKYTSYRYPMYCKSKNSSLVVKLTASDEGWVIVNNKSHNRGEFRKTWSDYNKSDVWQRLDVCEITGFFDGQLVWCWDNRHSHRRVLLFYDVKNKLTYDSSGKRVGFSYDNYEPFEGNYPDWALEAFQTLDID